ncbi:MAG: hypothetical protein ABIG43_07180 [Chloroflexota bacterium]
MRTELTYIGTFIVGGVCGGFLNHYGAHLLDRVLGRIRLEISPNPRSGPKYHGYYAAAEVDGHREENNIFVISCDLNNHSKKPFIIHDYSAAIRTEETGDWIELSKLEVDRQHLNLTKSCGLSIGFKQFDENPILISNLIDTNKLEGEFIVNTILAMKLPLDVLRLNNRYDNSGITCRIKLCERRGLEAIFDFTLKRLFYKKFEGSGELGYFDSSYKEAVKGSGILVKE